MAATDVLLVEGSDDLNLFFHLLKHHGIPVNERNRDETNKIMVVDGKGYENLRDRSLPGWLLNDEIQRLGVVVDADTHLMGRWQSLRQVLEAEGYTAVPPAPVLNGTIIKEPNKPTVGIWIMPDNQQPGMLENFVRTLLPTSDMLWPYVDPCLQHIPPTERRWNPLHHTKAEVHTWLAWQQEPGTPMGLAITRGYLDANAQAAQQLVDWIRRVFAGGAT